MWFGKTLSDVPLASYAILQVFFPGNLELSVYENPEALVDKYERRVPLKACVCASCGYTELFANDLETLSNVYDKREMKKNES